MGKEWRNTFQPSRRVSRTVQQKSQRRKGASGKQVKLVTETDAISRDKPERTIGLLIWNKRPHNLPLTRHGKDFSRMEFLN